jgi:hypothetical protein
MLVVPVICQKGPRSLIAKKQQKHKKSIKVIISALSRHYYFFLSKRFNLA